MYGIREDDFTPTGRHITVWSGGFYETFEASGLARDGARRITLTTYNGDKVAVGFPGGTAFPRTDDNFRTIDAAIEAALIRHHNDRGDIRIG